MKKSDFGSNGDFIAENEMYLLRLISDLDKENYIITCRRTSGIPSAYLLPKFGQNMYDNASSENEINFSIVEKTTGSYCGYCNFRSLNEDKPEIGISLLPEYQRKGIGYQALSMIMRLAADRIGVHEFIARVYNDNTGSRRLMEKLGAIETGRELSELAETMQNIRKTQGDEFIEKASKKYGFSLEDERYIIVYTIDIATN